MTIHYRFTDTKGRTHTRTSRGHTSPRFTHGVVADRLNGRIGVSFCGSERLAQAAAVRDWRGYITEICKVEASERPFAEQVAAKRKRTAAARADLAQLASDEESERRGLAMMSGDLEG